MLQSEISGSIYGKGTFCSKTVCRRSKAATESDIPVYTYTSAYLSGAVMHQLITTDAPLPSKRGRRDAHWMKFLRAIRIMREFSSSKLYVYIHKFKLKNKTIPPTYLYVIKISDLFICYGIFICVRVALLYIYYKLQCNISKIYLSLYMCHYIALLMKILIAVELFARECRYYGRQIT